MTTERCAALAAPMPDTAQLRERLLIAGALLSLYVVWGSTYYALRVALGSFPPFLLAGVRFLLGGAILYAFLRARGAVRPTRLEWGAAARVGFLLLVIGNGGVTYAEQWVSSSLAAVVVATMPLWAALFGRLFGQSPTRGELAGLGIGFVGVVLLNLEGELAAHGAGALALAVSPLSWALGSVWSRRLPLPRGPMATAAEMLTAGPIMIGIGLLRSERLAGPPSAEAVGAFAYLLVFGSLLAFSAYVFLLQRTRAAVATSYAYVNPVVAIAIGVGLGGEHVGALTALAALVITAGVALVTLSGRGR